MNNNGSVGAFGPTGRFDFTVRADDDHVSVSRPVSSEDVDRVRRQIAEWMSRRPAHPA